MRQRILIDLLLVIVKIVPQVCLSFTNVLYFLHSKTNSQVEYKQRILTSFVAYAIIVYQYIHNLSNNFSSSCEASDIYREKQKYEPNNDSCCRINCCCRFSSNGICCTRDGTT